ncbi:MAG: RraA family protein [Pseudomonadota bacterium]
MLAINARPASIKPELLQKYKTITPAAMGHHIESGIISSAIKPARGGIAFVGTAITVQCLGRDSAIVHKVIDMLQPGDVLVIDRGGDMRYACWGEMMTLAAHLRGCAGVILDGLATDIQFIRECPMPVFSKGFTPLTTQLTGSQGSINQPIQCGGVVVQPGDLVCADDNGVAILDPALAEKLYDLFAAEEEGDAQYRDQLNAGKLPSELSAIDALFSAHSASH